MNDHAQRLALERLHQRLPRRMAADRAITEDESLRLIIEHSGLYAGDYASAQAARTQLVGAGALLEQRDETGRVTGFRKGRFPEPVGTIDAVAKENEHLARLHAEERARWDREHAAFEAAQLALNASSRAAEEREFLRRLDEVGVSPAKIREIVAAEVEAAIERHLAAI